MTGNQPSSATFYFDPSCPWTWRTSRWFVDVTARHGVPVAYRAFDLSSAAPLEDVPEQYRSAATASRHLLRLIEQAHAEGADDVIGTVYTAYGNSVFDEEQTPSVDLVESVVRSSGAEQYISALTDESLDATVASARREAQQHSGDDTGSPVLVLTTATGERGFFGPVLAPTPTGDGADRIWDLVVSAAAAPEFFELKARRTASP